jgi:Arc/MetJ family transcription regulator
MHMRTNIEIDDTLMAEAMAATGFTTKRATVQEALGSLLRERQHAQTMRLFDSLKGAGWAGDLDAMRDAKPHNWPVD